MQIGAKIEGVELIGDDSGVLLRLEGGRKIRIGIPDAYLAVEGSRLSYEKLAKYLEERVGQTLRSFEVIDEQGSSPWWDRGAVTYTLLFDSTLVLYGEYDPDEFLRFDAEKEALEQ
jgi:hypothetical protein